MRRRKSKRIFRKRSAGLLLQSAQKKDKRAKEETPLHPLLQMQHSVGNQAVGQLIQTKLKIGQPGDKYEQ